jgi:hypothetical protein
MSYINNSETGPNKALYYKANINNIISDISYNPELGIKYMKKELEF